MPVTKVSSFKAGAVGQVFRVSLVGLGPDGTHINTFYVRQVVASFTGNVFYDIWATWDGAVKATYLAMFPGTFSLQSMRVQQVDDGLKGLPAESLSLAGTGSRTTSGDRLPGQCAGVLEFNTGFSGRRGRGRNFIGVLHEGDQADGTLQSTMRNLMEDYGALLRTTFDPGTSIGETVVWTKISNTVSVVISERTKFPVYTQRRRRSGVGS